MHTDIKKMHLLLCSSLKEPLPYYKVNVSCCKDDKFVKVIGI